MICESCGIEFFEDWRKDPHNKKIRPLRFCSRSCANHRFHTLETKAKISESLLRKPKRFCKECGKELSHNNVSGICRDCHPHRTQIDRQREYRKSRKKVLVEYKGGKCQRCGYDKCLEALEFHHRDPSEKDYSVASSSARKKYDLASDKKEVDKCDLLCSNCHKEVHFLLRAG